MRAHTFVGAKCFFFRNRVNGTGNNIDVRFASLIRDIIPCPADGSGSENLDALTPETWDNRYFRNLIETKGLLQSDQELYSGGSTNSIVEEYDRDVSIFRSDVNPITDPNAAGKKGLRGANRFVKRSFDY
ncbi:peroxidase, putative [Ricinus communis]|uniref:peroxidase n=1 Tax=Ricinus communis TaxID=3988 RepID=B9RC52_RICCO|nr:peroxidase, putative [Ricinus communis]